MDPLIFILMLVTPMIPWCLWPKRGTRSRAALTGYRWGFTPLAILPLGLIVWMVGRVIHMDLQEGGMIEALTLLWGLLGLGISTVVGIIAAIVCGVRWKRQTDKCEHCSYSLVGLTSDKCPECGHTVSSTAPS